MEDKRGHHRLAGSKVSQIANIFQAKPSAGKEDLISSVKTKTKGSTSEMDSPGVTVMRTESHVTRFNNARALFEKLGAEETRGGAGINRDRVYPLQATKSASNILDLRSRSSSANSETRDTKSHDGSRSPSPSIKNSEKFSNSVPALSNSDIGSYKSNGFSTEKDICVKQDVPKVNGNDDRNAEERTKPTVAKKPDKPERKFNSKELIEKQRNWTSHFSKSRTSRYNSDPGKTDVKLVISNGEKEDAEKIVGASRSASFSMKIETATSPSRSSDVTRRQIGTKRERPASVIPTTSSIPLRKDYGSSSNTTLPEVPNKSCSTKYSSPSSETKTESPTKETFDKEELPLENTPTRCESLSSASYSPGVIQSDTYKVSKPHTKWDLLSKNSKAEESDVKVTSNKLDCDVSPTKSESGSSSQENLQATVAESPKSPVAKSIVEEKETSRENLSATSGSLSSLSPPSSPSRNKTENEKQEVEGNEKSQLAGKYVFVIYNVMTYF